MTTKPALVKPGADAQSLFDAGTDLEPTRDIAKQGDIRIIRNAKKTETKVGDDIEAVKVTGDDGTFVFLGASTARLVEAGKNYGMRYDGKGISHRTGLPGLDNWTIRLIK